MHSPFISLVLIYKSLTIICNISSLKRHYSVRNGQGGKLSEEIPATIPVSQHFA